MKALDVLPNYLRERIGNRKIALVYVIRDNEVPEPLRALEIDSITSQNYESMMDELIARSTLAGAEYNEDNALVYQIIQDIVAGSSHESSIKSFRRNRDGRGAYFALVQHNMGSSKWDRIVDTCESYLLCNEWNGKNVRFTLKMHINKHREAYNELVRASQFISYEVPNDHTRVSRLIKSITSKDGAILASITHIQGTAIMRDDFESAADFLLLNAPTPKEMERSYRISAVGLANTDDSKPSGGGKKNAGVGKSGVELRYHSKIEYNKLNNAQKKELHEWRANKSNNGNNDDKYKSRISSLETQLKELLDANKTMQSTISSISTNLNDNTPRNPLSNPLNQRNN